MADSQRKTANLCPITSFDKTTDTYYSILFNTPIPAGTYTLSAKITSTSAESRISFRKADMAQIITSNIVIQTGRSQLTVTLNESCYGMYIYGGTTVFDNIPIKYENIMLNTGSTPLPYEPYYVHSLRKLDTDTDTITTLPAVLYPTGTTATVGLKGNMSQTGTPTPQNPVMPNGTGERTRNLFDKDNATPVSLYYQEQREIITTNQYVVSIIIPVSPNTTYTFNNSTGNRNRICETETIPEMNDTVINYISSDNNASITLTTSNDTHYILWWVGYQQAYSDIADTLSVNTGSTALPYEPYGYKIPISSANTTTPVYLGEVESTRRIKKYEFTGQETWGKSQSTNTFYIQNTPGASLTNRNLTTCSHFEYTGQTKGAYETYYTPPTSVHQFNFVWNESATVEEWKSYLAQQYAAGTPVTIWYVLATETTGIVNEPIRKIGDYADEVSGITIPVTAGGDSVDVETTVKPSEVSLTYTGWHDAQCKEYDGSQWV